MTKPDHPPGWDPRSEAVTRDPLAAYDAMRQRCPVAYSDYLNWSLFRHEDVVRVLRDHQGFSNAVSAHLSVPNGMDPPVHTPYRRIIEPFFEPEPMAAFEPHCRAIARELVAELVAAREVEANSQFGQAFALRVQCRFLGWPEQVQTLLRDWLETSQRATLTQDRPRLAQLAQQFTDLVAELLETRRQAGAAAPADVTTELLRSQVDGRPLDLDEITSVLRNWTAGEIGTIAASVGILVHFLAEHPDLHRELREQPDKLPEAIDEILRIHGPLVSNRRLATCPAMLGGREIRAGERLTLLWVSANRDEAVFENPTEFRWGRDPDLNLLYGAGIHVCPGAPLARLELRIVMEELLRAVTEIALVDNRPPVLATYPASGYERLWVSLRE